MQAAQLLCLNPIDLHSMANSSVNVVVMTGQNKLFQLPVY